MTAAAAAAFFAPLQATGMFGPIRKLVSRRLQAALCLLAVTMQVSAPVLHTPHATILHPELFAKGSAGALLAAHEHDRNETRHDASTCSQCRLVSQLGSLVPLSVVAAAPAVDSNRLDTAPARRLASCAARDSGGPRAPPSVA